jgi:hypothetical protein
MASHILLYQAVHPLLYPLPQTQHFVDFPFSALLNCNFLKDKKFSKCALSGAFIQQIFIV